MDTFSPVLGELQKSHPELFSQESLTPRRESEPILDVNDFKPLESKEYDIEESRPDFPVYEGDGWGWFEEEGGMFESSDRARDQRRRYGNNPSVTGIEFIALYRPFHYYGLDDWGILFSERNLIYYTDLVHRAFGVLWPTFSRHRHTWIETLEMVTYAVARHEFTHYLTELDALSTELRRGSQVYIPYHELVYKPTYPSDLCLEETVASVWEWENPVICQHTNLREAYKLQVSMSPGLAYRVGAKHDRDSVHNLEDRLVAQTLALNANPPKAPQVWGTLPRPYSQPWTRYENVPYTITKSAGGILAPILGADNRIKKTIRVYHR